MRRKRLETYMKYCLNLFLHKITKIYWTYISSVKDRGYQESDSEDNHTNGIDALINTLTEYPTTIQNERKENCIVKQSKSQIHSIVYTDAKIQMDNSDQNNVRRRSDTYKRNTKEMKKNRTEENLCCDNRNKSGFNVGGKDTNYQNQTENEKRELKLFAKKMTVAVG